MSWRSRIAGGGLAVLMAAMLVLSMTGSAAAANNAINYSAGPNPMLQEDSVVIAEHNGSEMSSVLQYWDDNGDIQTLPGAHNASAVDNKLGLRFDQIEDDTFTRFPRDDGAEWNDASEWTTVATGARTVSVTDDDGSTAEGVESIKIATDGSMAAGDNANASYANFSITSDATKRVPFFVFNVDTLDAGATVEVRFVDADDDYVNYTIKSGAETIGNPGVVANATGNGYVAQQKLADLPLQGSGDGSLSEIQRVQVNVSDADATLHVVAIDPARKSTVDLGDHIDADDETVNRVNVTNGAAFGAGEQNLTALSTLGSLFDDADFHDLRVRKIEYRAQDLASDDVSVEFSEAAAYGSYPTKVEIYYDLVIPSAIDLTHNGLTFVAEQKFVDERYATVEYLEGAGDNDFGDASGFSDLDSTYSSEGDQHDLDTTVSSGTVYRWHGMILLTDDDESSLKQTGGAAGGPQGSGGGLVGFLMGLPGAILTVVVGIASRAKGWTRFPWVV